MSLTKRDINILCKMETLIGMNEKLLFGEDKGYNEVADVCWNDFRVFWSLIQREIESYEHNKEYANIWNKNNPSKHREQARASYYRVKARKQAQKQD